MKICMRTEFRIGMEFGFLCITLKIFYNQQYYTNERIFRCNHFVLTTVCKHWSLTGGYATLNLK